MDRCRRHSDSTWLVGIACGALVFGGRPGALGASESLELVVGPVEVDATVHMNHHHFPSPEQPVEIQKDL